MIWQPEFTDKTLSRKPGAVQLSHMLQGLESQAVYDYVASHKGVCALEHDGFVSYEEVTDWSHPYLLIEKKH
ncbi:hypothetical protein A15Y_01374 [Escherichia coli KTE212]|nr:hypothetical protein A15Y_01374 [Escherichia coli KTE212]